MGFELLLVTGAAWSAFALGFGLMVGRAVREQAGGADDPPAALPRSEPVLEGAVPLDALPGQRQPEVSEASDGRVGPPAALGSAEG